MGGCRAKHSSEIEEACKSGVPSFKYLLSDAAQNRPLGDRENRQLYPGKGALLLAWLLGITV